MINIKPIIGIISREYYSETNREINIVYNDVISSIIKSGGIPIGIPCNEDISLYLDICSGFVLQGGDDIDKNNLRTIKMLHERDIPLLGICLGMQEMVYENDNMIGIDNHQINSFHEVNIRRDTLLYRIIKKEKILVNSRHKSMIVNPKFMVSATSRDGVIEAIEVPYLKFFLGVQWHPENMYDIDSNAKSIFDYFIKICNN